jgi:hypothetical protein
MYLIGTSHDVVSGSETFSPHLRLLGTKPIVSCVKWYLHMEYCSELFPPPDRWVAAPHRAGGYSLTPLSCRNTPEPLDWLGYSTPCPLGKVPGH